MEHEADQPRGQSVSRAEWIAIAAVLLNILTLVFGAGTMWADIQEHDRRLDIQEAKLDELIPKVERIDANVSYLAERAREDRAGRNR